MPGIRDVFAPEDKMTSADKLRMGSPARTLALREDYTAAREETDISWEDFLAERGYGADANGNAYKTGK